MLNVVGKINPQIAGVFSRLVHPATVLVGLGAAGGLGYLVGNGQTSNTIERKVDEARISTKESNSKSETDSVPALIQKIRPGVVRIVTEDTVFSGVVIRDNENNKYILSCGHGVPSEDKYKNGTYKILNYNQGPYDEYIEFNGAPYYFEDGKPAYLSRKEGDLMLLKPLTDKELQALEFRDASLELEQGTLLFMLGSPHGVPNTLRHGFSGLYREISLNKGPLQLQLQIDGTLEPGSSGEPSVDKKGNIVALNSWKMNNQGVDVNIGFFAVSAISIQDWLESNGIHVTRSDAERDAIRNWLLSLDGKGDKNFLRLNYSWPEN